MSVSPDRSTPPTAGEPRRTRFPAFERTRLDSGPELLVAPRRAVPLVDVALLIPAGGDRNPLDCPGLASLTAALVDEGSSRRSGYEIVAEVERLGGGLVTGADWSSAQVELSLTADDLERGLEILIEVATTPAFPETEIDRLKRQALTELDRRRDRPALLAEECLSDLLYGGTVYGHLLQGTRESLAAMDRKRIVDFHHERYDTRASHLVIVGDVDVASTRETVARLVEDAAHSTGPAVIDDLDARPDISTAPPRRRIVVVDRPEAAQTELRIGQVGVPRTHPDRTKLGVLNALLGGKFTSRLNLNLRERRGITYGVSSRFVDRRAAGPFVVATAIANESVGEAVDATLGEIERLREEAVSPGELDETKRYLIGVFPYTLQTNQGLLARLADIALHRLPDDQPERALEQIESTRTEEILELARRHLRPELAAIVAVGPAAVLSSALERFGPVEIRSVDESRST